LLTANYDYIPGIQIAQFNLPFEIDLRGLEGFFQKRHMKTRIRKGRLTAQNGETYIHVSRDGSVEIRSFRRIRTSYFCKRIAGFRIHPAVETQAVHSRAG